jgi:hypothetical protein
MKKTPINEASISNFINKFLDDIQRGTQKRFIAQAKKRGVSPHVMDKLTTVEKEIIELRKILDNLN